MFMQQICTSQPPHNPTSMVLPVQQHRAYFFIENSVMEKVLIWIYFFSNVVRVHDSLYDFLCGLTCKHVAKPQNETICILHKGGGLV